MATAAWLDLEAVSACYGKGGGDRGRSGGKDDCGGLVGEDSVIGAGAGGEVGRRGEEGGDR